MQKLKTILAYNELFIISISLLILSYINNVFIQCLIILGLLIISIKKQFILILVLLLSYVYFIQDISIKPDSNVQARIIQAKEKYAIASANNFKVIIYPNELLFENDIVEISNLKPISYPTNFDSFSFDDYLLKNDVKYQADYEVISLKQNYLRFITNKLDEAHFLYPLWANKGYGNTFINLFISLSMCIIGLRRILYNCFSLILPSKQAKVIASLICICLSLLINNSFLIFRFSYLIISEYLIKERIKRLSIFIILSLLIFQNINYSYAFLIPCLFNLIFCFDKNSIASKSLIIFLLLIQLSLFNKVNLIMLIAYPILALIASLLFMISSFAIIFDSSLLMSISKYLFDLLSLLDKLDVTLYLKLGKLSFILCLLIYLCYLQQPKLKYLIYICLLVIQGCYFKVINLFPQVTFFDIGQGDCILIDYGFNQDKVFYDCGDNPTNPRFEYNVLPYLRYNHINVDYFIVSHDDADHIGSLIELEERYPKMEVIVKPQSFKYGSLIQYASDNSNESSLIYHTKIGNLQYLFTGDIYQAQELRLMREYPSLKADILKVAHHGSLTSSNERFISNLKARYAIIGVGANNYYGHPHKDVLAVLERQQLAIYDTASYGAIRIINFYFFNLLLTARGNFVII